MAKRRVKVGDEVTLRARVIRVGEDEGAEFTKVSMLIHGADTPVTLWERFVTIDTRG